jgi:hypothetical protein
MISQYATGQWILELKTFTLDDLMDSFCRKNLIDGKQLIVCKNLKAEKYIS